VPRQSRIKAIFTQLVLSGEEAKIFRRDNQVAVTALAAYRAVTFMNKQLPAHHDFIANGPTVAASPDKYFGFSHKQFPV
jgi:hypothetical protein